MDPLEHITRLVVDVPSWLLILDEQKDQIGLRQAELARISASSLDQSSTIHGPSARSLKNKGSAESLRPKMNSTLEEEEEEGGDVAAMEDDEDKNVGGGPKKEDACPANPMRSTSSSNAHPHITPRSPREFQRKTSTSKKAPPSSALKASPSTSYAPQTQLLKRRKSKSSSIHSIHSSNSRNSHTPSHPAKLNKSSRTKSMVIVYYDSHVQEAFEKLVKHISSARNNMRKGKMAERRMRMLAEMEDDSDNSKEEEVEGGRLSPDYKITDKQTKHSDTGPSTFTTTQNANVGSQTREPGASSTSKTFPDLLAIEADDSDNDDGDNDFLEQAKLQIKSTRMMGPGRLAGGLPGLQLSSVAASTPARAGTGSGVDGSGNGRPPMMQTSSTPTLKTGLGSTLGSNGEDASIYDKLDKSLEWCQSTCERAAHRFLRDGECYTEIADVRKRLEDVVAKAKTEVARLEEENKSRKAKRGSGSKVRMRGGSLAFGYGMTDYGNTGPGQIRPREKRSALMRKSLTPTRASSTPAVLESTIGSPTMKKTNTSPYLDEGLHGGLEVDEEEDEGLGMDLDPEPPKLIFRSTRAGGHVMR